MELGRTELLAILMFCLEVTWGAEQQQIVKEGADASIRCQPPVSNRPSTIWLRVRKHVGMEFIATFDLRGGMKAQSSSSTLQLDSSRITSDVLTVKSFQKEDSGLYGCAVIQSNALVFGQMTELVAEAAAVPQPTVAATSAQAAQCTTAAACVCDQKVKGQWLHCTPMILGPLAGGCGLLLLLLIITSLYCNKIRTRRCPHHHKRKPRTMPGGTK